MNTPTNRDAADVLLKLAERCEKEEPSRVLDIYIAFAVLGDMPVSVKGPMKAPVPYMLSEDIADPAHVAQLAADDCIDMIPRYTTSLDAAVTLVPEDYDYILGTLDGTPYVECGPVGAPLVHKAIAKTPALALCAAALRARASLAQP